MIRGHAIAFAALLVAASLAAGGVAGAQEGELLPWQQWQWVPAEGEILPLHLLDAQWESVGGREGTLSRSEQPGPWGGPYLRFHVQIDHLNEGRYPQGWPAFQHTPPQPLDFSEYDAIQYWVRRDTEIDRPTTLRFILHTDNADGEDNGAVVNELIDPLPDDQWALVTRRLDEIPDLERVSLIHFFLCENAYAHGDEVTFEVGGFRLCKLQRKLTTLPADEAAVALYVGERANSSDEIVILDEGARSLPVLLVWETGSELLVPADTVLRLAFREVFSGKQSSLEMPLGEELAAGETGRVELVADLAQDLAPGYYSIIADLVGEDGSLLGGRVGSDDLYVRRRDESMTFTVLSVRTGMVKWVQDLLYGDVMCRTDIHLPHTYDPLREETYAELLRLFGHTTGKHTEGNEAGDTGLLLAAEAFRKSGDMQRCQFTEAIIEDSFQHMIDAMQAPNGATIMWTNELVSQAGIGKGGPSRSFGSYDSNQIGEWITPLARGMIYYSQVAERPEYARRLSAAARKAAQYIVDYSRMDSDGIPDVIRHLRIAEAADGSVNRSLLTREDHVCNVYLGRTLSGLAYYAYAAQVLGEDIPQEWFEAMDATVRWTAREMKPNGWFDWRCGDRVEGGCHTFLGNIYIGEGLFGCYLADRQAGRTEQAALAQQAAAKAYHYVTDDCWNKGTKYTPPLEFWVGPYLYWLWTEWTAAVGPDERFEDWLATMDRQWSEERQWRDFLVRDSGAAHRTGTNGMLEISILGYLAIKHMEEIGRPFELPAFPDGR
ncbi:MAG: hypothetical protein U9R79_16985 [Armatimonadota bacterium]|nr:hypothetical protein [Armatimonadota bacterium]